MLKTGAKRGSRTATKKAAAKGAPNKIDVLAAVLKNVYWNGFEQRGTSYRIARSRLRDIVRVQRLEAVTMKKLIERVREDGFILYPVDKSNYARASQWIFASSRNTPSCLSPTPPRFATPKNALKMFSGGGGKN